MQHEVVEQEPPSYETWLRATHAPAHSRRTAERNAAFLLPHLQAGMRLIDAGCGPGSITIGLARAVAPGEVVGIDIGAEAIEAARARASAEGCDNVRFEVAEACALPFAAATFDAAFAHALLQHLPFPLDALVELRRVLKRGGVIGVADADFDGAIIAPESELLLRAGALLRRTRRNPHIGKHLRGLLHHAGFRQTIGSVTAGARGDGASVRLDGEWNARYFEAAPFIEFVTSKGWATADEMREMAAAWRAWAADPGAFSASFWCQAVGWADAEPTSIPDDPSR